MGRSARRCATDHVNSDGAESDKTPFSFAAVTEHFQRSRKRACRSLSDREKKTIFRKRSRARRFAWRHRERLCERATLDTRKLEDSLTGLERMLNDSMLSDQLQTELDDLKNGVKDQLKPYRSSDGSCGLQTNLRQPAAEAFARAVCRAAPQPVLRLATKAQCKFCFL